MPRRVYRVRVESPLRAPPEVVWEHATTIDGVNEELAPLRMSAPPGARITGDVPLGRPLFRSRVTVAGLIPIDLHEITLASFEPGRGFHETSRSLLEARWIHRRSVRPAPHGCVVEDDVTFEPRAFGALVVRVVSVVFRRRHEALRRRFGAAEGAAPARATRLPPRDEDERR